MKVPYHKEKIKDAFKRYLSDFETSFCKKIEEHEVEVDKRYGLFKCTYPLFVLLESLRDARHLVNPAIEIILQEALHENNKEENNKEVVRDFGRKLAIQPEHQETEKLLEQGLKRRLFTPYFHELYSDSLILLNAYYTNNYRGAYIALRTILEDLYRHLYYKDHPQEFMAVNDDGVDEFTLGLSPQKFREYLPYANDFKILSTLSIEGAVEKKGETVFGRNNALYKKTSAYVHAAKMEFMSGFTMNSSMSFDVNESKKIVDISQEVMQIAIICLICAHRTEFLRFSDYAKSLILEVFGKKARHNFRKHLNI